LEPILARSVDGIIVIAKACPAKGDRLTITFATAGDPMLVTGPVKGWTGVLMPMRV
jgi:hypothetical protein